MGAICSLISMVIATTTNFTFTDCTLHHMLCDKAGRETASFSSNRLCLPDTLTLMSARRKHASLLIYIL